MCSPTAAFMGLQVAGGLQQSQGYLEQGAREQAYYNYMASISEKTAGEVLKRGDQQSTMIQDVALQSQEELDRQSKQLAGRQKTVLAASGVWGNSRTAQDIARDTASQEDRDAAALRYNADVSSWQTMTAAKDQALALRRQAVGYRMGGDNAVEAARINAQSSIINTATNVAGTYVNWTQNRKTVPTASSPASSSSIDLLKSRRIASSKLSLY